jgi:hypothetical protein
MFTALGITGALVVVGLVCGTPMAQASPAPAVHSRCTSTDPTCGTTPVLVGPVLTWVDAG